MARRRLSPGCWEWLRSRGLRLRGCAACCLPPCMALQINGMMELTAGDSPVGSGCAPASIASSSHKAKQEHLGEAWRLGLGPGSVLEPETPRHRRLEGLLDPKQQGHVAYEQAAPCVWIQSNRGTLRMSRQHLASVKVLRYVLAKLDFLAANVFLHTEVISIWSHQWAVWYANPSGLKDYRMQY